MTTISAIQASTTKASNLFVRGAIICGKRVEHWSPSTEEALLKPLRWKKPRRIFVNSMSDLFHPSVPDEWIDKVFAVMALTPHHTYQVPTKRADRMRDYIMADNWESRLDHQYDMQASGLSESIPVGEAWPLPNVWLGTSVEDQSAADARIPDLLATPAAVRFLSMEPLLGPVDLECDDNGALNGAEPSQAQIDSPRGLHYLRHGAPRIDWVIVGGESGPHARPMHPDWVRSIRNQCAAAGVSFFFKQWGEWFPKVAGNHLDGVQHLAFPATGE